MNWRRGFHAEQNRPACGFWLVAYSGKTNMAAAHFGAEFLRKPCDFDFTMNKLRNTVAPQANRIAPNRRPSGPPIRQTPGDGLRTLIGVGNQARFPSIVSIWTVPFHRI